MKLVFSKGNNNGLTECPFCNKHGYLEHDGIEDYYIWCENCKKWFERGFQIHSGD